MKKFLNYEKNEKNNKDRIKINSGIQILRMLLSFFIVQIHCYDINKTKNRLLKKINEAKGFYVPTFYVISYFFSFRIFKIRNINKIKLRLERFLIPYITWPSIFFVINYIMYHFNLKNKIELKCLLIQLITGKKIYNVLWFHTNLILTFLLNSILIIFLKNNYLFVIQLIGIFGYIYNYIHFYFNLFNGYCIEVKSLIQDFGKILFYSSIGISLGFLIDIKNLRKERKKTIFFSLFILYLIRDFLSIYTLFYYLRCILFGIGATCLFILFALLPFDIIENKKINSIILTITNYTCGIYFLHSKVDEILNSTIAIMINRKNRTLIGCILNYIICYIICFFGVNIFGKSKIKYLFI